MAYNSPLNVYNHDLIFGNSIEETTENNLLKSKKRDYLGFEQVMNKVLKCNNGERAKKSDRIEEISSPYPNYDLRETQANKAMFIEDNGNNMGEENEYVDSDYERSLSEIDSFYDVLGNSSSPSIPLTELKELELDFVENNEIQTNTEGNSLLNNSVCDLLVIASDGRLTVPPPRPFIPPPNNLSFVELMNNFIKRNNFNDLNDKITTLFKKLLYREPNGAVYKIHKNINKKEIEERLTYNCMPPQPEYFDPNNKELGYKCWYDIENPHPYKNPFEMFIFVDKYERIKLEKLQKYSCKNLSNGRIICLVCAILNHSNILHIDQLQDWDVIDTYSHTRRCKGCSKLKKEMHYNQIKHSKQCTFCASRRTYTRCILDV